MDKASTSPCGCECMITFNVRYGAKQMCVKLFKCVVSFSRVFVLYDHMVFCTPFLTKKDECMRGDKNQMGEVRQLRSCLHG